jgi:hypothetical protein
MRQARLLHQHHSQPSPGGIPRNAGAVDAPAHDKKIEHVLGQWSPFPMTISRPGYEIVVSFKNNLRLERSQAKLDR